MSEPTLYTRCYDAIAAVSENLVSRLKADSRLGRFWAHRGDDGVQRETQLLIDFLCHAAGGPMHYSGRDMKTAHKGMRINEDDWKALMSHIHATLEHFKVPTAEREAVIGFVQSTKADIVEEIGVAATSST